MAAKNDITGQVIKTKAPNRSFWNNYDKIFRRKTAIEWCVLENVTILDADGFKWDDGVTVDTPISYKEFCKRIVYCTTLNAFK